MTNQLEVIRAALAAVRANVPAGDGDREVKNHFRWLVRWAADPQGASALIARGHWAEAQLRAALELVELGAIRARPNPNPPAPYIGQPGR